MFIFISLINSFTFLTISIFISHPELDGSDGFAVSASRITSHILVITESAVVFQTLSGIKFKRRTNNGLIISKNTKRLDSFFDKSFIASFGFLARFAIAAGSVKSISLSSPSFAGFSSSSILVASTGSSTGVSASSILVASTGVSASSILVASTGFSASSILVASTGVSVSSILVASTGVSVSSILVASIWLSFSILFTSIVFFCFSIFLGYYFYTKLNISYRNSQ